MQTTLKVCLPPSYPKSGGGNSLLSALQKQGNQGITIQGNDKSIHS